MGVEPLVLHHSAPQEKGKHGLVRSRAVTAKRTVDLQLWANRQVGGSPSHDLPHNRIDIKLDDGGTTLLWWTTKNVWLALLDVTGLDLEALYGGFDRSPLNSDSREYIFVAARG